MPVEPSGNLRDEALSAIAREVRYRDVLYKLRCDLERLQGRTTYSGREVVAREMFQTIDRALAIGDFAGLPDAR